MKQCCLDSVRSGSSSTQSFSGPRPIAQPPGFQHAGLVRVGAALAQPQGQAHGGVISISVARPRGADDNTKSGSRITSSLSASAGRLCAHVFQPSLGASADRPGRAQRKIGHLVPPENHLHIKIQDRGRQRRARDRPAGAIPAGRASGRASLPRPTGPTTTRKLPDTSQMRAPATVSIAQRAELRVPCPGAVSRLCSSGETCTHRPLNCSTRTGRLR